MLLVFSLAKLLLMAIQRQHGCTVVVILMCNSQIIFSFYLILRGFISPHILPDCGVTVWKSPTNV